MDGKDDRSGSKRFHPTVFKIAIGLTLWMVLASWGFSGRGYAKFALTIVSLLILGVIGLQLVMWRISRRRRDSEARRGGPPRLRDWLADEVEIWQGHFKGSEAAAEILIPFAAAAIGMTSLALVLHFAVGG